MAKKKNEDAPEAVTEENETDVVAEAASDEPVADAPVEAAPVEATDEVVLTEPAAPVRVMDPAERTRARLAFKAAHKRRR